MEPFHDRICRCVVTACLDFSDAPLLADSFNGFRDQFCASVTQDFVRAASSTDQVVDEFHDYLFASGGRSLCFWPAAVAVAHRQDVSISIIGAE